MDGGSVHNTCGGGGWGVAGEIFCGQSVSVGGLIRQQEPFGVVALFVQQSAL